MRPHESAAPDPSPRTPMNDDRAGRSLKWWIIGIAVVEAIILAAVILQRL